MADGLVDTSLISPEAIQRVILALNHSIEKLDFDPKKAIAVTTAAMRKANNNQEVLQEFEKETGVKFSIY